MLSKDDALRAISELNFWENDQETGIIRLEYLKKLTKLKELKEATVLVGVRRCGKTTIAKQLLEHFIKNGLKKEQTLYVNFDEPILNPYLTIELLDVIFDAYRERINPEEEVYVILDEIQNIPAWEKWVSVRQENKKLKIIATGSSSKLLSSEFSTVLGGRSIQLDVFPLSFIEFISFRGFELNPKKVFLEKRKLNSLLREYLEFGGFPRVVLEEKDKKAILLKEYFNAIVLRDVAARYNLKDTDQLKALATILCTNISSPVSVGKLAGILQESFKQRTSLETVSKYMHYLESAYLVSFVKIFSYKIKNQLLYPRKVYCVDCGLRNTVSFRFLEDLGTLYENAVYLALKQSGKEIYYWKNEEGKEVDFIIKDGLKVRDAIQVCFDIRKKETKEREISALAKCMEEFNLREGTIITEEVEKEEKVNGKKIRYIPLWKWFFEIS